MEAKNLLLGILPNNLLKTPEKLFRYMVTATTTTYVAKWKSRHLLKIRKERGKPSTGFADIAKYAEIAKLTTHLRNRSITKFAEMAFILYAGKQKTNLECVV